MKTHSFEELIEMYTENMEHSQIDRKRNVSVPNEKIKKSKKNKTDVKYDKVVDLHGKTRMEAQIILDSLIRNRSYCDKVKRYCIITGKGRHSDNGNSILKDFVEYYLFKIKGVDCFFKKDITDGNYGSYDVRVSPL